MDINLKNSYFLALLSSSNVNVASVEADKHAELCGGLNAGFKNDDCTVTQTG